MKMRWILELSLAVVAGTCGVFLWCGWGEAHGDGEAPQRTSGQARSRLDGTRFVATESSSEGVTKDSVPAAVDTPREEDVSSEGEGQSNARGSHRATTTAWAPIPVAQPRATKAEPGIPEALARVALRFCGIDPAAEETWTRAINDPQLSEDARSNLIEDLNEDGFPDPSHMTRADIPLILERMRLIERLAPHAMDEVNAAAFREAYKDLVNMLAEALESGT